MPSPLRPLLPLWLLLFVSCGVSLPSAAQRPARPVTFFEDPAGKTYLLLSDSRLITRNQLGGTVNTFYDSSLGAPDHVDVTNPFSIILYYQDYGRLVLLDRTLSEITRIDLFNVEGLQQPGALARANDNQIWVYDDWDYRLKLLDEQGRVARQTNNLRLDLKVTQDPAAIYVDRGTVALYFPELNRLAVLTNYGRFEFWVDLPPTEQVSYQTPYLTGYDETDSWRYVMGAKKTERWARPQVQGAGEQTRRPGKTTYRYLNAAGEIITTTVE